MIPATEPRNTLEDNGLTEGNAAASPVASPENAEMSPEKGEDTTPEAAQDDPAVASLAAALRNLSPAQRAALAQALLDDSGDG